MPRELLALGRETHANSLAAVTGVNPSSGGLFNTASMAGLLGVGHQHLENIINEEPDAAFVWHPRPSRVYASYVSSLTSWWDKREAAKHERLVANARERQSNATRAALKKLLQDV